MKIALGTVQFGLNYGVSNTQGQVPLNEVKNIIQLAKELGIDTLDCAPVYGNSEKTLGEIESLKTFNIITKIPKLSANEVTILPYIQKSLCDLKQKQVSTLLFHNVDDLIFHQYKHKFYDELIMLKQQGLVTSIGASLYQPSQWQKLNSQFQLDILQVPVNALDQRFISHDLLLEFQKNNIKLHCRSLFLQGLLLMEAKHWPDYFVPFKKKLNAFHALAKKLNISKLTLALAIVVQNSHISDSVFLQNKVIDKLIVGCCSTKQLEEIILAYQEALLLNINSQELSTLASNQQGLINPSLW